MQTPFAPSGISTFLWLGAGIVAVIAGGLWFFAGSGNGNDALIFPHASMVVQQAGGTQIPFDIEVATSPEQKQHGLMFRHSLPKDAGMLFIWNDDQPVSMWMKNTYIPLDMLYVARDGTIVKIITNAEPLNLTPLPSGQPVHAVIEINAGEAAHRGIKTGDKVLAPAYFAQP